MPLSELERRLLTGTLREREAEAKQQGIFEVWETKARRDQETRDKTMDLTKVTLAEIANIIRKDWKKVYFGAVPYLNAMTTLNTIRDMYGADDGKTIVNYFLANANTWRGETARQVKKELKRRVK